jgi:hypothetical protein
VLPELPLTGTYRIQVAGEGLAPQQRSGIQLRAGQTAAMPVLGRKLSSLPLLDSAVRSARGTGDLFTNNTLFVINGGGRRRRPRDRP